MTAELPGRTFEEAFGRAPEPWTLWSDGSSLGNPGPAGWAVYVETPGGEAFSLHGSSVKRTNNEAELHALFRAIQAVPLGVPAVILSDSEYAIKAATTYRAGWQTAGMKTSSKKPVANADRIKLIWAALDERPGVRLGWVKSHAGDHGNEIVDSLARGAAEAVRGGGRPVKEVRQDHPNRTKGGRPLPHDPF